MPSMVQITYFASSAVSVSPAVRPAAPAIEAALQRRFLRMMLLRSIWATSSDADDSAAEAHTIKQPDGVSGSVNTSAEERT